MVRFRGSYFQDNFSFNILKLLQIFKSKLVWTREVSQISGLFTQKGQGETGRTHQFEIKAQCRVDVDLTTRGKASVAAVVAAAGCSPRQRGGGSRERQET